MKVHSTIGTTPFARFFNSLNSIKIRKKSSEAVKKAFLHTTYRKVNNDATVSFETTLYEVPPKYIGQKIEIRYDPSKEEELYLYEKEKQVLKLKRLDRQANAKFPVKFGRKDEL